MKYRGREIRVYQTEQGERFAIPYAGAWIIKKTAKEAEREIDRFPNVKRK